MLGTPKKGRSDRTPERPCGKHRLTYQASEVSLERYLGAQNHAPPAQTVQHKVGITASFNARAAAAIVEVVAKPASVDKVAVFDERVRDAKELVVEQIVNLRLE